MADAKLRSEIRVRPAYSVSIGLRSRNISTRAMIPLCVNFNARRSPTHRGNAMLSSPTLIDWIRLVRLACFLLSPCMQVCDDEEEKQTRSNRRISKGIDISPTHRPGQKM